MRLTGRGGGIATLIAVSVIFLVISGLLVRLGEPSFSRTVFPGLVAVVWVGLSFVASAIVAAIAGGRIVGQFTAGANPSTTVDTGRRSPPRTHGSLSGPGGGVSGNADIAIAGRWPAIFQAISTLALLVTLVRMWNTDGSGTMSELVGSGCVIVMATSTWQFWKAPILNRSSSGTSDADEQ